MRKRASQIMAVLIISLSVLSGCKWALQRGMLGDAYISTARPSISLSVKGMPLMTAGSGIASLNWSGEMGGLNILMWLAVYGEGGLAPMAIVAQAQAPENWYWNGIMNQPFSVDQTVEVFNGVDYQACTFIINPATDPFGQLVTGEQPDGQPQLWIARAYAARFNFNNDKIILQYREPLPADISSLTTMPLGYGSFLQEFAQRARSAFVVENPPANIGQVKREYPQGIQWQFMQQNFLGDVTRYENMSFR